MVPSSGCGDFSGETSPFCAHSETLVGCTVGSGIETLFASNWTARVEYL
jgi:opacity protein-like surface antigen